MSIYTYESGKRNEIIKGQLKRGTAVPDQALFFSRMKILLVLVCLLAIFTSGCSKVVVVYRVNLDSPPKMEVGEARAAINRVLSLTDSRRAFKNISLKEDEFVVAVEDGNRTGKIIVNYNGIKQEIRKMGNHYVVPAVATSVTVTSGYDLVASYVWVDIFTWKSEEEARLFLDAVHALRQSKTTNVR
jgi:hypothetical protein